DGIAVPGWLHRRGMRLVQAYLPILVVGLVEDQDLARRLDDLRPRRTENKRRRLRPTLRLRIGKALATARNRAEAFHDLRRLGLQDGILVIADQRRAVACAGWQALNILDGPKPGRRRLVGEGISPPESGQKRNC